MDDRTYAKLPTEQLLAAAADLDRLSPAAIVRLLAREERNSVAAVERAAPRIARVAARVTRALAAGGRLVYAGAGTSGRLATLDAAECPPTFGTSPRQVVALIAGGRRALTRAVEGAEDRAEDGRCGIARLKVGPKDVVVGVAASGITPYVRAALDAARAAGAATALVTCAPAAARAAGVRVDTMIGLQVGAEVLAGSTRLKAGTATKLALNAITTAAMIGAGKAYGPRMVDVRATNAKLRARARRMLAQLAGLDGPAADRALRAAGGRVKTAIVMSRLGLSRRAAETRLRAAGGHLRRVIGAPR